MTPVAWIFTWYEIAKDRHVRRIIDCEEKPNIPGYDLIPLYTAQPQRQPLTDDDLFYILHNRVDYLLSHIEDCGTESKEITRLIIEFARAIERAHGIGGEV